MQLATSIETDNGEMIVKQVSVPVGLEELMEGLTKEVLLKKPKDIYVFASEYFAKLLELREKGAYKVTRTRKAQFVTKQTIKDKPKSYEASKAKVNTNSRMISPSKKLPNGTAIFDNKEQRTKSFLDKRKSRNIPHSSGDKDKKRSPRSRSSSSSINSSNQSVEKRTKSTTTKVNSNHEKQKQSNRKVDYKNKVEEKTSKIRHTPDLDGVEIIAKTAPMVMKGANRIQSKNSVVDASKNKSTASKIVGCKMTESTANDFIDKKIEDKENVNDNNNSASSIKKDDISIKSLKIDGKDDQDSNSKAESSGTEILNTTNATTEGLKPAEQDGKIEAVTSSDKEEQSQDEDKSETTVFEDTAEQDGKIEKVTSSDKEEQSQDEDKSEITVFEDTAEQDGKIEKVTSSDKEEQAQDEDKSKITVFEDTAEQDEGKKDGKKDSPVEKIAPNIEESGADDGKVSLIEATESQLSQKVAADEKDTDVNAKSAVEQINNKSEEVEEKSVINKQNGTQSGPPKEKNVAEENPDDSNEEIKVYSSVNGILQNESTTLDETLAKSETDNSEKSKLKDEKSEKSSEDLTIHPSFEEKVADRDGDKEQSSGESEKAMENDSGVVEDANIDHEIKNYDKKLAEPIDKENIVRAENHEKSEALTGEPDLQNLPEAINTTGNVSENKPTDKSETVSSDGKEAINDSKVIASENEIKHEELSNDAGTYEEIKVDKSENKSLVNKLNEDKKELPIAEKSVRSETQTNKTERSSSSLAKSHSTEAEENRVRIRRSVENTNLQTVDNTEENRGDSKLEKPEEVNEEIKKGKSDKHLEKGSSKDQEALLRIDTPSVSAENSNTEKLDDSITQQSQIVSSEKQTSSGKSDEIIDESDKKELAKNVSKSDKTRDSEADNSNRNTNTDQDADVKGKLSERNEERVEEVEQSEKIDAEIRPEISEEKAIAAESNNNNEDQKRHDTPDKSTTVPSKDSALDKDKDAVKGSRATDSVEKIEEQEKELSTDDHQKIQTEKTPIEESAEKLQNNNIPENENLIKAESIETGPGNSKQNLSVTKDQDVEEKSFDMESSEACSISKEVEKPEELSKINTTNIGIEEDAAESNSETEKQSDKTANDKKEITEIKDNKTALEPEIAGRGEKSSNTADTNWTNNEQNVDAEENIGERQNNNEENKNENVKGKDLESQECVPLKEIVAGSLKVEKTEKTEENHNEPVETPEENEISNEDKINSEQINKKESEEAKVKQPFLEKNPLSEESIPKEEKEINTHKELNAAIPEGEEDKESHSSDNLRPDITFKESNEQKRDTTEKYYKQEAVATDRKAIEVQDETPSKDESSSEDIFSKKSSIETPAPNTDENKPVIEETYPSETPIDHDKLSEKESEVADDKQPFPGEDSVSKETISVEDKEINKSEELDKTLTKNEEDDVSRSSPETKVVSEETTEKSGKQESEATERVENLKAIDTHEYRDDNKNIESIPGENENKESDQHTKEETVKHKDTETSLKESESPTKKIGEKLIKNVAPFNVNSETLIKQSKDDMKLKNTKNRSLSHDQINSKISPRDSAKTKQQHTLTKSKSHQKFIENRDSKDKNHKDDNTEKRSNSSTKRINRSVSVNEIHDKRTTKKSLNRSQSSFGSAKLHQKPKNDTKTAEKVEKMEGIVSKTAAVVKIQALWRGYAARKHYKKLHNTNEAINEKTRTGEMQIADAVLKIQALWRGFNVRKLKKRGELFGNTVEAQDRNNEDLRSSKRLKEKRSHGALKIQSLWRGYKVRKSIKDVNTKLSQLSGHERKVPTGEDIMKAATKIQANVRGYNVRKKLPQKKPLMSIAEENTSDANKTQQIVRSKTVEEPKCVRKIVPTLSLDLEKNPEIIENPKNSLITDVAISDEHNYEIPHNNSLELKDSIDLSSTNKQNVVIMSQSGNKDELKYNIDDNYENSPTQPVTSSLNKQNTEIVNDTDRIDNERSRSASRTQSCESTSSNDSSQTVILNDVPRLEDRDGTNVEKKDEIGIEEGNCKNSPLEEGAGSKTPTDAVSLEAPQIENDDEANSNKIKDYSKDKNERVNMQDEETVNSSQHNKDGSDPKVANTALPDNKSETIKVEKDSPDSNSVETIEQTKSNKTKNQRLDDKQSIVSPTDSPKPSVSLQKFLINISKDDDGVTTGAKIKEMNSAKDKVEESKEVESKDDKNKQVEKTEVNEASLSNHQEITQQITDKGTLKEDEDKSVHGREQNTAKTDDYPENRTKDHKISAENAKSSDQSTKEVNIKKKKNGIISDKTSIVEDYADIMKQKFEEGKISTAKGSERKDKDILENTAEAVDNRGATGIIDNAESRKSEISQQAQQVDGQILKASDEAEIETNTAERMAKLESYVEKNDKDVKLSQSDNITGVENTEINQKSNLTAVADNRGKDVNKTKQRSLKEQCDTGTNGDQNKSDAIEETRIGLSSGKEDKKVATDKARTKSVKNDPSKEILAKENPLITANEERPLDTKESTTDRALEDSVNISENQNEISKQKEQLEKTNLCQNDDNSKKTAAIKEAANGALKRVERDEHITENSSPTESSTDKGTDNSEKSTTNTDKDKTESTVSHETPPIEAETKQPFLAENPTSEEAVSMEQKEANKNKNVSDLKDGEDRETSLNSPENSEKTVKPVESLEMMGKQKCETTETVNTSRIVDTPESIQAKNEKTPTGESKVKEGGTTKEASLENHERVKDNDDTLVSAPKSNSPYNKINSPLLDEEIEKFNEKINRTIFNDLNDHRITTEEKLVNEIDEHDSKKLANGEREDYRIPLRELSDITEEEAEANEENMKTIEENKMRIQGDGEEMNNKTAEQRVNSVSSGSDNIVRSNRSQNIEQQEPQGIVINDENLPLTLQLINEATPAGVQVLASSSVSGGGGGGDGDADNSDAVDGCNRGERAAQASNKDASPPTITESDNFEKSTTTINQRVASDMDATEKRRNNINNNLSKRNMESEAATKIQAGFRGYQVRKQLKNKITTTGDISNQRRLVRRKSSGQMKKTHQTTTPTPTEIEERSAAKIQAGVRGFLVRRRQKKEKSKETTTS